MIKSNAKEPWKILERLANEATVEQLFWSRKQLEKRKREHPELYQPGFFYQQVVTSEEKEILKNLKSEDIQNICRYFLHFYD